MTKSSRTSFVGMVDSLFLKYSPFGAHRRDQCDTLFIPLLRRTPCSRAATGRCPMPEDFLYDTHVGIHARCEEERVLAILQEEVVTTRGIPGTDLMLRLDDLIVQLVGKIIRDVS